MSGGLTIQGAEMETGAQMEQHFDGGPEVPSILDLPSAGCWRLTLVDGGGTQATVTMVAVDG
jgi:hypothetical protein